jgi:hypothetical protein
MSAIGSYEVLNRAQFQRCLDAARNIRTETSGRWLFKTTRTAGASEFAEMWQASTRKQVVFEYSGYVLGNYVDAQQAINQAQIVDEESDASVTLAKAFTAAFVFDTPISLRGFPADKLNAYCRDEYGEDGAELLEPIRGAHHFFEQGIAEITDQALVVFIIR